MHPNEMKLTHDNIALLMNVATLLSKKHVQALQEQMTRQNFTPVISSGKQHGT